LSRRQLIPRKYRKRIIGILTAVLGSIFLLDGLLLWTDPLGAVAYSHSTVSFIMNTVPDETGYRLNAGEHYFHYYTMTIDEDGYRVVPDTDHDADCTIAMIGDSVTMGIGVDDAETWVNLVARDIPDVRLINTARSDYAVQDVYQLMQTTPADGYIWLMIENDVVDEYVFRSLIPNQNPYLPATRLYLERLRSRLSFGNVREVDAEGQRSTDFDNYWDFSDRILSNDNVFGFAFETGAVSRETAERYDNVVSIPHFGESISTIDFHPSVVGHQNIANSVADDIESFVDGICAT